MTVSAVDGGHDGRERWLVRPSRRSAGRPSDRRVIAWANRFETITRRPCSFVCAETVVEGGRRAVGERFGGGEHSSSADRRYHGCATGRSEGSGGRTVEVTVAARWENGPPRHDVGMGQ